MTNLSSSSDNIHSFLNLVKQEINSKLNQIVEQYQSPCSTLQAAIRYVVSSNGKRLRPALLYATYNLIKAGTTEKALNPLILNAACAMELIHTYSLVHDDLPAMDNDDLRRGLPACHIKFGEATAILVGDGLQTMAFNLLSEYYSTSNFEQQIVILNILSKAAGIQGMIAGQSMELNQKPDNQANKLKSTDFIDTIHLLKTGKLIAASLQIGAKLAACTQPQYELINLLGIKLGLAFQVQDDLLDYTKSSSILGKPALSDQKRALPTYPTIMGVEQAQTALLNLWGDCFSLLAQLGADNNSSLFTLITLISQREH